MATSLNAQLRVVAGCTFGVGALVSLAAGDGVNAAACLLALVTAAAGEQLWPAALSEEQAPLRLPVSEGKPADVPRPLPPLDQLLEVTELEPFEYVRDIARLAAPPTGFRLARKSSPLEVTSASDRKAPRLGSKRIDRSLGLVTEDSDFVDDLFGPPDAERVLWEIDRLAAAGPLVFQLDTRELRLETAGCRYADTRGLLLARAQWVADRVLTLLATRRIQARLATEAEAALGFQIEVLGPGTPGEEARCRVCGDEARHEIVRCRRCEAPHHLGCWEYAEGCSIYACRSTSYSGA